MIDKTEKTPLEALLTRRARGGVENTSKAGSPRACVMMLEFGAGVELRRGRGSQKALARHAQIEPSAE